MKRLIYLSMIVFSAALHPSAARAQWMKTNGPSGGSVYCITTFGNDIFIGTGAGIFESTDSGLSWLRKSNGLPNTSIYSIVTHGTNIFTGTAGNGVYRSTDSGASWVPASNGLPTNLTVPNLVASNTALFIADGISSYVSTDEGNDWTQLDSNLTKFSEPQTAIFFDSAIYFAGNWVTKTTNNGSNWTVNTIPPQGRQWLITSLVSIGDLLFDINLSSSRTNEWDLLESTDSGQSWYGRENTLYEVEYTFSDSLPCLGTMGDDLFVGNGPEIYRSTDDGYLWESASTGLSSGSNVLCIASCGSILFAGLENAGVYRSFDSGRTWMISDSGLREASVNTLSSSNDSIFAGAPSGFFLSTDNGTIWQPKMNGMGNSDVSTILKDGENLFVGTQGGKDEPCLFESTNGGNSWNPDTLIEGYNINALFLSDSNLFAGGSPFNIFNGTGFFLSVDDGILWNSFQISNNSGFDVTSFAKTDYALYATTSSGLYYSFTNGANWSPMHYYTSSGDSYDKLGGASVLGQIGNMAFLAAKEPEPNKQCAIFYTDTMGNWLPIADTSVPAQGMVTAFASTRTNLFIATDSDGVFLTTDSGASWIDENRGLGDSDVTSLEIEGNELFAGTASSGVWRRPLAEMIPSLRVATGKQSSDAISVYPDPASSIVTVSCTNLNGRTEASLISETGSTVWEKTIATDGQPFHLDLTGVANGAYQLELNAGGVSQSSKIVLQR